MTDARLDAAHVEALTRVAAPSALLDAAEVVALTSGSPSRSLDAAYTAVLTPSLLVAAGGSSASLGHWGVLQAQAAGGGGSGVVYRNTVMALSPMAYYQFDNEPQETFVADSSGASRHLIISGTQALSTVTPGRVGGKAWTTSGGTPIASTPTPAWWGGLTAFSVMVWFKATGTGNQALFCSDNTIQAPGDARRKMSIYLSNGQVVFMRFTTAGGFPYAQSPLAYNDGNWHCVVVTTAAAPGTAAQKVYVDGALVVSQNSTGTWAGTGASANLTMAYIENSSYPLNGSLDEIAVFGRELTAGEVSTLYTGAL